MSTYLRSIGCFLYARCISPEQLPPSRWRLGQQTSIAVNGGTLACSALYIFLVFLANTIVQTLDDVNWAVVIFVGVFVIALAMYVTQGRKSHRPPADSMLGRGVEEMAVSWLEALECRRLRIICRNTSIFCSDIMISAKIAYKWILYRLGTCTCVNPSSHCRHGYMMESFYQKTRRLGYSRTSHMIPTDHSFPTVFNTLLLLTSSRSR